MTLVIATNALARTRGFLASCMLELAPGVYTAPRMSKAVRERVWTVISGWYAAEPTGSLVMTWPDKTLPGGQAVMVLGAPPVALHDHDGLILVRRDR
jgi:CRISPR-associated protein Cas2